MASAILFSYPSPLSFDCGMLCASAQTLSTLEVAGPPAGASADAGPGASCGCAWSAGAASAASRTTARCLISRTFIASGLIGATGDRIQVPGHDIPVRASFQVRVQVFPRIVHERDAAEGRHAFLQPSLRDGGVK